MVSRRRNSADFSSKLALSDDGRRGFGRLPAAGRARAERRSHSQSTRSLRSQRAETTGPDEGRPWSTSVGVPIPKTGDTEAGRGRVRDASDPGSTSATRTPVRGYMIYGRTGPSNPRSRQHSCLGLGQHTVYNGLPAPRSMLPCAALLLCCSACDKKSHLPMTLSPTHPLPHSP